MKGAVDGMAFASNLIFLLFLVGIPLYGFCRGVKIYDSFIDGAKDAFGITIKLLPYLTAIIVVVNMLRASGIMEHLAALTPTFATDLGLSPDIISLIFVRPMSGAASLGILGEIIASQGPDSYAARLGAVILGSTETTLYVVAVYMGAVAVTRVRYAIHAGLIADAAGVIAALFLCKLFFR